MKKSKIAILLMILFFMFVGVVEAKENPFALDWRDKESIASYGSGMNHNLKYRDGYLTIYESDEYDLPCVYVRYYDIEGNVIREKKLNNMMVLDAITNDENVYMLVAMPNYDYYPTPYIVKLDDNFNVEEGYDLSDEYTYVDTYNYGSDYMDFIGIANYIAPEFGMSTLSIVNDRLYILGECFAIRSLDLDLATIKTVKPEEGTVKRYFPNIYNLAKLTFETNEPYFEDTIDYFCEYELDSDCEYFYEALEYDEYIRLSFFFYTVRYNFISADTSNSYIAASVFENNYDMEPSWLAAFLPQISRNESLMPADEDYGIAPMEMMYPPQVATLALFDKDGRVEWVKENSNYEVFTNVKLVNNYIVVLGLYYSGSEDVYSDIVIYDLDGKLVQTIESRNDGYAFLASTNDSFLVTDVKMGECYYPGNGVMFNSISGVSTLDIGPSYCEISANTEHYALPYNINVDLDGEAEVNANEQSFAGKKETIEVIPKEGYKVDSIIVTDSEGNVLEVEDNTFTMPASDVNVAIKIVEIEKEVEEPPVIENPNTSAFSITGIAIVAVGLGIVGIRYFKKLKFLK